MRETEQTTAELVEDMLSKDARRIWRASCGICSLSQNHDRVMELVPHKQEMYLATRNIELGGAVVPNSRFLEQAFRVIELHEKRSICPCRLMGEESNPQNFVDDGYMEMVDTVLVKNSRFVDYYVVRCKRCQKLYKVEEREYHYTWWNWMEMPE